MASPDTIAARLDQELDRMPKVSGPSGPPDQVYLAPRLNRLFTAAEDEEGKTYDVLA